MKAALAVLAALAAFPLAMQAADNLFYVNLATRMLIYAIAASSLNLVLGYGGMVSFGHAAFFGAGAYIVGILAYEGVTNLWIAWPLAVAAAALAALVIGAISLRTRGVYFIMITLAFAQMMYYIFVSLKAYGGDDGLSMPGRSTLGFGLDLRNELTWYYAVLLLLAVILYFLHRLVRSRFGRRFKVATDGVLRRQPAGAVLRLAPGESVTLMPGSWHAFWGEGGDVLIGEVSTVNNDLTDNIFAEPIGRFAAIEEDEDPLHLLVSDYPKWLA